LAQHSGKPVARWRIARTKIGVESKEGGTLLGWSNGFAACGYRVVAVAARPVDPAGRFSALIPGVAEGVSRLVTAETLHGHCALDVPEREALDAWAELRAAGIPAGKSSGLNVAALRCAAEFGGRANPFTVLPDHASRYEQ
jgi:cysteine synthase